MVRMYSDVNTIRMFIRMGLFMIVQSIIMIAGTLTAMFLTNVKLASVMAVIMPATLVMFFLAASYIRPAFMKVREALDKLNNVLQESLAGIKLVKAFAMQPYEFNRFEDKNREYYKVSLKIGYLIAVLMPLLFFIGQIAILVTLWLGGTTIIKAPAQGGLTLGQLVAFSNYAMMAMFPLIMLGMVFNFISMASVSAARIDELIKETPDIKENSNPIDIYRFKGKIEFKNVSLSYGEGENAVDDVSITISPGEKIGILGTTGSGKTSMVNLIPRFYDPQEGTVFIDDIDIKQISFSSLRTRITAVLQEPVLFSGSIRDNIKFGKRELTDDDVKSAACTACAENFILEKENKWDEPVGERGTGLSGGQRQRIAIAQAVAADPDILILDDVTSSLDMETEQQIIGNLFNVFKDKTVLIISQKISTLVNTDRIIVLEKGKIIGAGNHDHLIKTNRIYRDIYDTQKAQV